VNLLSDGGHPMQALADLLTLRNEWGDVAGRKIAYVGDGNNVCRSLVLAAGMLGMDVAVAAPAGYQPPETDVERFRAAGIEALITEKVDEALDGADAVYTDAWYSMGQEAEANERRPVFQPYQVNRDLMGKALPDAVFLHCLPAHRGDEVVDEVLDGRQSRIWPQAENRMHAARGLLAWLLSDAASDPGPSA
jgi:ornithine carbamoyltransferase